MSSKSDICYNQKCYLHCKKIEKLKQQLKNVDINYNSDDWNSDDEQNTLIFDNNVDLAPNNFALITDSQCALIFNTNEQFYVDMHFGILYQYDIEH